MKPKRTAGKGRDRHFLSSRNAPGWGRCFARFISCFISCEPHKRAGEGGQGSEKMSDLSGSQTMGIISCPQPRQTQGPEPSRPGRPRGS